jgi:hypothetical protein
MKRTVITFGLLSGALAISLMILAMLFQNRIGFDYGFLIGYTVLILTCLLVFPGIRSYRENVGGGAISFGRAFAVGILISLIASVCYVVVWEIVYFNFMPDFCDRYAAYMIEKVKASGAGPQVIEAQMQKMREMKAILNNPLKNAAFSFLEPFPIGLLVTLISAAILRKKRSDDRPHQEAESPLPNSSAA